MKNLKYFSIYLGLALLISFSACKKDDFDFKKVSSNFEWNPSFAIPIVNGNVTIRDMLRKYDNDSMFGSDKNNLLYIVYESKVGQYNASEKFNMPDNLMTQVIKGSDIPQTQYNSFTKTQYFTLSVLPLGSEIDSVYIKSVTLRINFSSKFKYKGNLTITFPSITRNGAAYFKSIPITTSTGSFTYNEPFEDMAGYKMKLVLNNNLFNQLKVEYKLSLNNVVGVLPAADAVNVNLELKSLKYTSMFGYFGNEKILLANDSISVKMFSEAFTGGYFFEDPKLKIQIKNSFGVPISLFCKKVRSNSINPANPPMELTFNVFPFYLNKPLISSPSTIQNYGQELNDSIVLNKDNSNLKQVVGNSPNYVIFEALTAEVNPGITHPHTNYVNENSKITADLRLELPFWGWAKGLEMKNTDKFDFSKYHTDYRGSVLRRALFRITTESHMPVEMGVQLYFGTYDSITDIFSAKDSLLSEKTIISAGITDSEGRVITSTTHTNDIIVQDQKLINLKKLNITHIRFKAFVNANKGTVANPISVKFFNTDNLKIYIGLQCDFSTNTFLLRKY